VKTYAAADGGGKVPITENAAYTNDEHSCSEDSSKAPDLKYTTIVGVEIANKRDFIFCIFAVLLQKISRKTKKRSQNTK